MTKTDSINPFKDDMTGRLLLGRYRVVRRLAAGGMGVVYLARAEGAAGFVKPVVVKLILPVLASSEEFSGMFAREANILASLRHPGIVSIIEFAEEQDCNIMVLEYVHGFQLGQWKKYLMSLNREIPTAVAIEIIINVLDALHYAHSLKTHTGESRKIIHRDISPGNVMIDVDGHVKLVDFGIAFAAENSDGYKTTNKSFKGKLSYSAPELFANKKATVRSDIYSCGVTLHEALVGRNEFNYKDHASIVNAVLNHVPSSVHACRDDAPERIDEVIWKAMAKNPDHRYATAAEFANDLREISSVPSHKAQALLADLAREDFNNEMSEFLKVESLADRERAWRTPSVIPVTIPAKAAAPVSDSVSEISLESPPPLPTKPIRVLTPEEAQTQTKPERTSDPPSQTVVTDSGLKAIKPLLYIIVLLLLMMMGGAVVFFFSRPVNHKPEQVVVVQSSIDEGGGSDKTEVGLDSAKLGETEKPAINSSERETEEASDDTAKEVMGTNGLKPDRKRRVRVKKGSEKGSPDLTELTGAFRKQKGKIHRCFEQHQTTSEQRQNVSVLFSLKSSGSVERVQLSPQSLDGTALGNCLLGVSRATKFPPQSEPISFRIPLSAKRVKP